MLLALTLTVIKTDSETRIVAGMLDTTGAA